MDNGTIFQVSVQKIGRKKNKLDHEFHVLKSDSYLESGRLSIVGRKFLLLLALCFIFLSIFLSGCEKGTSTESSDGDLKADIENRDNREYLIRELSSDPQYLNPIISNDATSSQVEYLLFDSLLDIDGTTESSLVPRLAKSWDISEDKLTITFYIRKDIRWHDGEPLTAADVKFTFDLAMRPDVPAIGLKSIVEPLRKVEVIAPYTVQFSFKYPYAPALTYIGSVQIVPQHRLNEDALKKETEQLMKSEPVTILTTQYNRNPIGSGPYKFDEWKTAQFLKIKRNENFWDKEHIPSIKEVMFKVIPSRTVAFNMLRKGELDVMRARAAQYMRFERMEDMVHQYNAMKFYEPTTYYIAWNCRSDHPIFSDKKVRIAMTHALDRQAFIQKVEYGLGTVITGPFYFKSWAYNPSLKPISFDLEKAASLLLEAGWSDHDGDGVLDKDGKKFEFNLIIPGGAASFAQLASIMQANLKRLAIDASIRQYEWSVYLNRKRNGEFDAIVGGWRLGVDPDQYGIWHSSQIHVGNNSISYSNPEVDSLLIEGRRTFDRDSRQKIYWQVHKLIQEDQPYTFVFTSMETYILNKRIENITISPYGLFSFFPGQLDWKFKN